MKGKKMIRREAADLFTKLSNLKNKEYNKFLLYSIMKTKIELKKIFDDIVEKERTIVNNPKINEFETRRIEILKTHSEKDDVGNPKIVDGRYELSEENRVIVNEQISKLQESFKDDMMVHEKNINEYNVFVNESVDINISKTKFKNLPENMNSEDFELLMNLVDESDMEE